jgi:hypothetical protein
VFLGFPFLFSFPCNLVLFRCPDLQNSEFGDLNRRLRQLKGSD